jgi:hypothetical protein
MIIRLAIKLLTIIQLWRNGTMKKYTVSSVAKEFILREKRRGADLNITAGTSAVRHILDIASEDVVAFQVWLLTEIDKRRKK